MEENIKIEDNSNNNLIEDVEKPAVIDITKEDFQQYIDERPYLVMAPDFSVILYRSTREISREILVDYSTISKKIKDSLLNDCYCRSKTTGFIYYIRKLEI